LESVLSQSSLGNAMEICSAVENDLTLTYLNNIHFSKQVCRPILTQHGQHTIKDKNSNIIKSRVHVYEWTIFIALVCEQDSKGGMSNEFGEIPRED